MCNRALIKAMNTYCGLARKAVVAAASLKTAKDESAAVGNTLFNSIDFVDIV